MSAMGSGPFACQRWGSPTSACWSSVHSAALQSRLTPHADRKSWEGTFYIVVMWVKQCHKPSPSDHMWSPYVYRWYGYHSQSWVVYDCFTHITVTAFFETVVWWLSSEDRPTVPKDQAAWSAAVSAAERSAWPRSHSLTPLWSLNVFLDGWLEVYEASAMSWNSRDVHSNSLQSSSMFQIFCRVCHFYISFPPFERPCRFLWLVWRGGKRQRWHAQGARWAHVDSGAMARSPESTEAQRNPWNPWRCSPLKSSKKHKETTHK